MEGKSLLVVSGNTLLANIYPAGMPAPNQPPNAPAAATFNAASDADSKGSNG